MRSKAFPLRVSLIFAAAVLTACGGAAGEEPDVDATVQAAIQVTSTVQAGAQATIDASVAATAAR